MKVVATRFIQGRVYIRKYFLAKLYNGQEKGSQEKEEKINSLFVKEKALDGLFLYFIICYSNLYGTNESFFYERRGSS